MNSRCGERRTVAFRSGEWLVWYSSGMEVHRCWVPLNDREPPAWIPKRFGYRGCCCERPYLKAIYVAARYIVVSTVAPLSGTAHIIPNLVQLPVVVIWVRCPHLKTASSWGYKPEMQKLDEYPLLLLAAGWCCCCQTSQTNGGRSARDREHT